MKALKVILGIAIMVLGFVLLSSPIATELLRTYIVSIIAGVVGIVAIIDFAVKKHKGKKAGIEIAVGSTIVVLSVINIIFMLFNITIPGFTVAFETIRAIMILVAIIIYGIMTIVGAATYREAQGDMKAFSIITGVLAILAAGFGLTRLDIIIGAFGVFSAIAIIVCGILMIVSAFSGKNVKKA